MQHHYISDVFFHDGSIFDVETLKICFSWMKLQFYAQPLAIIAIRVWWSRIFSPKFSSGLITFQCITSCRQCVNQPAPETNYNFRVAVTCRSVGNCQRGQEKRFWGVSRHQKSIQREKIHRTWWCCTLCGRRRAAQKI